jgi:DNA repair ATPase RecN
MRRLWAAEDEVRDLASHLEISKENIRSLKRGYTEKLDEVLRQLKEKNREIEILKHESQGRHQLNMKLLSPISPFVCCV